MLELNRHHTVDATVEKKPSGGWRLTIPAGGPRKYRWAQLDDYSNRNRREFLWRPPLKLSLRARLSDDDLPGTWGFGFWNDPFSFGLGLQGMARRFPALPDAVWFFHASAPNHLAFSDHHPASGMLAAVFSSLRIPAVIMAGGVLLAPMFALPFTARYLRKLLGKLVKEDAVQIDIDPKCWHDYSIIWKEEKVFYSIDQGIVFVTDISPKNMLGLVVWVDNQFASFSPDGKVSSGTLENPQAAWMEIQDIRIDPVTI